MSNPKTHIKTRQKICPNCWGYYVYEGKVRDKEKIYDEEIAVQHHETARAFIRNWVIEYLDGVHLKRDDDELVAHPVAIHHPHLV